jgi:hypothetical protein
MEWGKDENVLKAMPTNDTGKRRLDGRATLCRRVDLGVDAANKQKKKMTLKKWEVLQCTGHVDHIEGHFERLTAP